MKCFVIILAVSPLFLASVTTSFIPATKRICVTKSINSNRATQIYFLPPGEFTSACQTTSTTALQAFLPPSNNRSNGGLGALASSLLTLGLTLAFFLSPLGAIVLSVFNSLLLLSFLTPFVLFAGYNLWQYFNTISGTCPSCGAPATVMKRPQNGVNALVPDPNMCFNCGAILVASPDNAEIELASGSGGINDGRGFFDAFFPTPSIRSRDDNAGRRREESAKRFRREQTIIDVDVED